MKSLKKIVIIGVLTFTLCGCGTKTNNDVSQTNTEETKVKETEVLKTEVTKDDMLASLTNQEKSWMGITKEQYLEDFDWLYEQMQENYPYFHVVYRKTGVDIDKAYEEYKKKVENCANDHAFYETVQAFTQQMNYVGHLSSWGYRYMSELENLKTTIEEFPQYKEQLTPYLLKLDNPTSQKNYKKMQTFYENLDLQLQKANEGIVSDEGNVQVEDSVEEVPNVETKLLQEGKIAYVKINGFDMDSYKVDKEILLPFYNSVLEYDNIIIDITENYGGGMEYFDDLVVAPLISEPISVTTYMLVKNGQNNRDFLMLDEGVTKGEWKKMEELPVLQQLNASDAEEMDLFKQEDYKVAPLEGSQTFKGKVWLLVSGNNYSSSEYAAMFSKYSGFATLVGEQTGGDGIGVDPAYIILPNSGLVVQYSPVYGVTQDGTGSEEFGTKPDIQCGTGESALDTCLKTIESE